MTARRFFLGPVFLGLLAARAFAVAPPSFERLARAIENKESHLRTLDAVLASLPASYRSYYSLVFDSRSLQPASPLHPRALVYGKDAHLVLAFTDTLESLEVMEFDDSSRRFRFHEIDFSADGRTEPQVHRDVQRCTLCHGSPARPRWDTYRLWPGVYGSRDDQFTFLPQERISGFEADNYRAFQAERARQRRLGSGRYRFLEDLAPSYDAEYPRPNTQLSASLQKLDMRQIAGQLHGEKSLSSLRYALAAVFTRDCDRLSGFFPPDLQAEIEPLLGRLAREIHRANTAALKGKYDRDFRVAHLVPETIEFNQDFPSSYYDSQTAALRFLVEGFSDERIIDWAMEVSPRGYEFDINGDISGLEAPLKEALFDNPSDRDLLPKLDYFHCDLLRQQHLAVFPWNQENRARVRRAIEALKTSPPLSEAGPFGKCVSCHLPGNRLDVPVIPFGDRSALVRRLATDSRLRQEIEQRIRVNPPGGKRGMPPDNPLADDERRAVQAFLHRLAE